MGNANDGDGIASLYTRASEIFPVRVQEFSTVQLIKVVLAVGSSPPCHALLEAAATEISQNRLVGLPAAQLLLVAQGLLPLGGGHPALTAILDGWAGKLETFEETDRVTGDQLAKLAKTLAPKVPQHERFWTALVVRAIDMDGSSELSD